MKSKKKSSVFPISFFIFIVFSLVLVSFLFYLKNKNQQVLGTTDVVSSSIKEVYVPLGTGSNTTTEWTDVKGAAGYIDTRFYGKMKKVVFEASLVVPSGSQTTFVRLYNATDKHPVWYSEMTMSGAGPELLVSPPITLDSGNKLYQVQLKSQLGALTTLTQSRVHIIVY